MDVCMNAGLPTWLSGKESSGQCWRLRRLRFNPWVRKMPWRRKWQPTPGFLPPWGEEPGGPQSVESYRVGHAEPRSTHARVNE